MSPTREDRVLRRIPVPLVEYPLEVLLAAWGVLSGIPLLLGVAEPSSITTLLPQWAVVAWAVSLTLGGSTIALGLLARRTATVVPAGLNLLGTACAVYALAILSSFGFTGGIPAWPLLVIIAALCWLRSWWLRLRAVIARRITEADK